MIQRISHTMMVLVLSASCAAAVMAANQESGDKARSPSQDKSATKEIMRAKAVVQGEGINGEASFVETENATGRKVEITVTLKGDPAKLASGLHGVHLHEVGKCEAPFTSAGGHFDPGPASNTDPDANHPFHMGDLPGIQINARGEGTLRAVTTRVTLSEGPVSLLDTDGSAVIIHKNPDQGITGVSKSGVSGGPRIACGVIQRVL